MTTMEKCNAFDREDAGMLLSAKLQEYKATDSVVIGIPRGGVIVAAKIAAVLGLPLEVFPCRQIKDPADKARSIGSVSLDDVVVQNNCHDIPQDYISHQIALLRTGLRNEWQHYYSDNLPIPLRYNTVIVVDDILQSDNAIAACLKSIMKQMPLRVIVAIPIVSSEAARKIGDIADEILFIQMKHGIVSGNEFYQDFPKVDELDIKTLLKEFKREIEV